MAVANARYYEGRYLAGVAAGRMTTTGVAGYVAGFAIPEVLQGVNAFALGMRSVNPAAQVKVVWLNTWFDPARERDAALTLFAQGVDVIAFHTGSNAVMVAAQERGKMAVAYHSDMRQVAPQAQIIAVTHEWGAYYTRRAKAVLDGSWTSGNVWGGIREGMVRVGDFGPQGAGGGARGGAGAPEGHRHRSSASVSCAPGDPGQHRKDRHRRRTDPERCADPGDGLAGAGCSGDTAAEIVRLEHGSAPEPWHARHATRR